MSKAKTGGQQCLYQQRSNTDLHGGETAGPKGTAPGDARGSKSRIITVGRPKKEAGDLTPKVMLTENR